MWPRVLGNPLRSTGNAGRGSSAPVFILQDEFPTDAPAGFSSPRQAIKGKLVRSADSASRVSVDAGDLLWSGATASSYVDPAYYYTDDADAAFVRSNGLTVIFKVINSVVMKLGFSTAAVVVNASQFSFLANAGVALSYSRQGTDIVIGSFAAATTYLLAATLRTTTGLELRAKGGAYSEWSTLFIDPSFNTTPLYPSLSEAGAPTARLPFVRGATGAEVGKLATTTEIISVSSPDTTILTGKADAVIQITATVPVGSAGNLIEVRYRQADANNYMLARIEWNGSAYQIVTGHVIAGVETLQGSPIVTFSATNVAKIQLRCAGSSHDFYSTAGTSWTKRYGTITDATDQTDTGVSVRNVNFTSTSILVWDYQDAAIAAILDRLAA